MFSCILPQHHTLIWEGEVNLNDMSLLLLRDAKADTTEAVDDFFRPLLAEGAAEASAVGSFLHNHYVPLPDLIIASPALRSKATLESVMRKWFGSHWTMENSPFPVMFDLRLYNFNIVNSTSGLSYINIVRNIDATKRRVLLVGHNPVIWKMAIQLTHTKSESPLRQRFPSSAFAELKWNNQFLETCLMRRLATLDTIWQCVTDGSAAFTMFEYPSIIGFTHDHDSD